MLELFKNYESDFLRYLVAANSEVSKMGNSKTIILGKVKDYLNQADTGYQKMAESLKKLSVNERSSYEARLQIYKQKTDEIKKQIYQKREFYSIDNHTGSVDQDLQRTLITGIKTEELGSQNLIQLHTQRNVIDNYNRNSAIEAHIKDTDTALSSLTVKKIKLKMSMMVIIFLEFIIIGLVLYIKTV
jgi:Vesicle transport v-SNARE protein N-terminus